MKVENVGEMKKKKEKSIMLMKWKKKRQYCRDEKKKKLYKETSKDCYVASEEIQGMYQLKHFFNT